MSTTPQPVDLERVRSYLAGRRLEYGASNSFSWSVVTENALILWTLENPQVLQIRGQWRGTAEDPESFQDICRAIANCNATRLSPKAHLLSLAGGKHHGVMAECNILTDGGLTEQQFYAFCESSLTAMLSFFADLERRNPNLVTWRQNS